MSVEVKFIELVLENCECVVLDAKHVKYFNIFDMYESFSVYTNGVFKHKCAKGFEIIIKNHDNTISSLFNNKDPLDRLSYCDVTQVHLKYDDETSDTFHIKWDGDGYSNDNQEFKRISSLVYFYSKPKDSNTELLSDEVLNDIIEWYN